MSESDESSDEAPLRTRSGALRAIHTLPTPQTSRRTKEGIDVDFAPPSDDDEDDDDDDEELLPPLPSLPAPKQGKSSKLLLTFRAAHKLATDNPQDRTANRDCLEAYEAWCEDEDKKAKSKKTKGATKKTAKRPRKDDEGTDDQDEADDENAPSTTTVLSLSHTTASDQAAIQGWLRGEGVLDGILDNRAAVTIAAISVGQTVIRNQIDRERLLHEKAALEQRKIDSQLSNRRFKSELLILKCRLLEMQGQGVAVGDLQSVAKQLEELEAEQDI